MASSDSTSQLSLVFDRPSRYGKEYDTWNRMKQRCYDPNTDHRKDYLDRGIKVCERWLASFDNFYSDMGPKPSPLHSIDRIDNDGDYTPENCRWATSKEQARNRRNTQFLTYKGVTKSLPEWVEITGINSTTLRYRSLAGWSSQDIFETPVEVHSPPHVGPKLCFDCGKKVIRGCNLPFRCKSCGCKERERKRRELRHPH